MKKIVIVLFVSLLANLSFSQKLDKENVPASVIKQFETSFPNAKNTKWELDFENYQVEFIENKEEKTAVYDKDGRWIKTVVVIKSTDIPKKVKEVLNDELGGILSNYSYEMVEKINEGKQETLYRMVMKKSNEPEEVFIFESGKVLKKEEE